MLTKENIQTITETIDKAEITFSHLRDDLIDHVCCEVECRLEQGASFRQAFGEISSCIGMKDLQEVQEKTLLLIDKMYCAMKTTMKISGVVSTSLLMISALFKMNHWPGANILVLTGFVLLCFLFLPSANYVMHKEGKGEKRPLLFVSAFLASFTLILGFMFKLLHWPGASLLLLAGGLLFVFLFFPLLLKSLLKKAGSKPEKRLYFVGVTGGIIYVLGILFKLNHWPGGQWLIIVGIVVTAFVFLPFYVKQNYKDATHVKLSFVYLVVCLVWFILTTALMTVYKANVMSSQYTVLGGKIQKSVNTLRDCGEFDTKRNTEKNVQDAGAKALLKARELDAFIQEIKTDLVKGTGNGYAIGENGDVKLDVIGLKLSTGAPSHELMGEHNDGKAYLLKSMIEEYKRTLLEEEKESGRYTGLIEEWLDTQDVVLYEGKKVPWEVYYFQKSTLAQSLITLSSLQRKVLSLGAVISKQTGLHPKEGGE